MKAQQLTNERNKELQNVYKKKSSPIQSKIYLFSIRFKLELESRCCSVQAMFLNVFQCRKASHCILEHSNGFAHAATNKHRRGRLIY